MKKALAPAFAAIMAISTVSYASASDAQSRNYRYEQPRQDHRYDRNRNARPQAHRNARPQANRARPPANWRSQAPRRYRAPAYRAPRGYAVRQWQYGQRMPAQYRTSYYVVDHRQYGLRAPPRGYQYVRHGNDVLLTAIATGVIASIIVGLFY